ncbi:MAG: hypothetical protein QGF36_01670 [Candidatus Marinimicrobia bacterium]|nr:hypothetical protein [Candidatus Neomarinimicrobiota bacterium]
MKILVICQWSVVIGQESRVIGHGEAGCRTVHQLQISSFNIPYS